MEIIEPNLAKIHTVFEVWGLNSSIFSSKFRDSTALTFGLVIQLLYVSHAEPLQENLCVRISLEGIISMY